MNWNALSRWLTNHFQWPGYATNGTSRPNTTLARNAWPRKQSNAKPSPGRLNRRLRHRPRSSRRDRRNACPNGAARPNGRLRKNAWPALLARLRRWRRRGSSTSPSSYWYRSPSRNSPQNSCCSRPQQLRSRRPSCCSMSSQRPSNNLRSRSGEPLSSGNCLPSRGSDSKAKSSQCDKEAQDGLPTTAPGPEAVPTRGPYAGRVRRASRAP